MAWWLTSWEQFQSKHRKQKGTFLDISKDCALSQSEYLSLFLSQHSLYVDEVFVHSILNYSHCLWPVPVWTHSTLSAPLCTARGLSDWCFPLFFLCFPHLAHHLLLPPFSPPRAWRCHCLCLNLPAEHLQVCSSAVHGSCCAWPAYWGIRIVGWRDFPLKMMRSLVFARFPDDRTARMPPSTSGCSVCCRCSLGRTSWSG